MAELSINNTSCVPCYGYLYNAYVLADARKMTSSDDWRYFEADDRDSLIAGLGGDVNTAGGKIKETGFVFWDSPNTGAVDMFDFSFIGAGRRAGFDGVSGSLNTFGGIRGKASAVNFTLGISAAHGTSVFGIGALGVTDGASVRFVKDAVGVADGVTTTYTGNDGKVYNAVCVNEIYWMTENLEETEYRNGDPITEVIGDAAWAALYTEGWCLYNDTLSYACKGASLSTTTTTTT